MDRGYLVVVAAWSAKVEWPRACSKKVARIGDVADLGCLELVTAVQMPTSEPRVDKQKQTRFVMQAPIGSPITILPIGLGGVLTIPETPKGVVLFAHGGGSSHLSPRNMLVAHSLHQAHVATLLFDLLTEEEASDRRNVFDIPLLARRLLQATDWLADQGRCRGMTMGYFGASTGAAAALVAAAQAGSRIAAVVSRGGRPDLANEVLPSVTSATLLIVGDGDTQVLVLNRAAFARLNCVKKLTVVSGATHLFEEPGKLEEVAELACRWFLNHLDGQSVGRET